MSKLTRNTHELLTDSVLSLLAKRRIITTLTFIETSSELIAKISGLQFRQVQQVKDCILGKLSSKVRNGAVFYEELLNKSAILPTSVDGLDRLLEGGLMTGFIYELCGGTSCGKSQICMASAANISHTFKSNVFYIDTKGDFSAHRLCNFLENKTDQVGEALRKIQVVQPPNAYELLNCLHDYIHRVTTDQAIAARLIIIDSLAALFYQFIGSYKEGNSLLSSLSSVLHYVSVEMHSAVLVTNLAASWQKSESEEMSRASSLGKFWTHIPKTRINMKWLQNSHTLLTVVKSSELPIGKSLTVTIKENEIT